MERIFRINQGAIIITLLLYFTIWGGILSQILVGLIQLVCFISILLAQVRFTNTKKIHLWVYGSMGLWNPNNFINKYSIYRYRQVYYGNLARFYTLTVLLSLYHIHFKKSKS